MEEETFEKRENQAMDEEKVAQAGSFCWNETCADYGQVGKGNIIKNGKTEKDSLCQAFLEPILKQEKN